MENNVNDAEGRPYFNFESSTRFGVLPRKKHRES